MSPRMSFEQLSNSIRKSLNMAKFVVFKEAILWLVVILLKWVRIAGIHLLFELSLVFFLHMPFLSSPVHSICGSTCAPQGKNARFRGESFLWPTKTHSCVRFTPGTTIRPNRANDAHLGPNSGSQRDVKGWHLLLQRLWCGRGCWFENGTMRRRQSEGQRRVGYHWSERLCGDSGGLILSWVFFTILSRET